MKKTLLFSMVLFAIISCKNETLAKSVLGVVETPFEKSISNHIQTSFNDPKSYEKISIEVLDTVTVAKKIKIYEERGVSHEEFDNEPKDKFLYYTVSHKYRAKNSFGALMVYDDIVSMDKDFNITGSHGVNE